jgi:hypothetical protein
MVGGCMVLYAVAYEQEMLRLRLLLHCNRSEQSHTAPNATLNGMHRLRMPLGLVWMGRSDPLHARLDR